MDGVAHLLTREEEQCHENLSENYTKKRRLERVMQNETEAGSRKLPNICFLREL